MNTANIRDCLSSDEISKLQFQKACSRDEFISSIGARRGYGLYVFNTHYSDQSGEHWLAAQYTGDKMCIFDSFGRHPKQLVPDVWEKAVSIVKTKAISWNSSSIQGLTTNTCGDYCVFFALASARGGEIKDIVDVLLEEKDSEVRDHAMRHFIIERFGKSAIGELTDPTSETFGFERVHMRIALPLWKALRG